MTDPDEALLFSVSKMTRLCLPANKAAEHPGAENGFDHLACYKLKQATKYNDPSKTSFSSATSAFDPGKPPKYKGGTVAIQTFNFGSRVLDLKGAGEFCTPALRSEVGQSDGTPTCGDGQVYATPGSLFEQCDDGNNADGDGCSATCVLEGGSCGDTIVQTGLGEECDDGNGTSGDGCSSLCVTEFCGDDITQVGLGEQCDGTDDGACPGACTDSCGCPGVVGPNNNGSPAVPINAPVAGADGCAVVAPTDITLNLLGLELPLLDVEVAATYVGSPATSLTTGLLKGFLDQATAAAIILPASLPLVGGQPLSNLLRVSELDTGPGGASGWWFHLNFTGEGAIWTGP